MSHARTFCLLFSLSVAPLLTASAQTEGMTPRSPNHLFFNRDTQQQFDKAVSESIERQRKEADQAKGHQKRGHKSVEERLRARDEMCQEKPTSLECQAHFAGMEAFKKSGTQEDYYEAKRDFERNAKTPSPSDSSRSDEVARHPENRSNTPETSSTGRETPSSQLTQESPTSSSPESTRRNAADSSGSRLGETLQNFFGTAISSPSSASMENHLKENSEAPSAAATMTEPTPLSVEAAMPDPEVNTGVAHAAVQCHRSALQAAQACSASLQRTQNAAILVQRSQLNAPSGTPSGCASVGQASAEASRMIHQEQQSCAQLLSQCQQACASSETQIANARGSVAAIQSAEGSTVCSAAQSTAAAIGINQTQIQAAYQAAAQCYQQTTGTELVPTTGGAPLRRAAADFGKALEGGSPQNGCPAGVCAADAGSDSSQLPDAKKLLGEDEGGGGRSAAVKGGGYKEAHDLPGLNSRFQATGPRRSKMGISSQPGTPGMKPGVPGKNPGFFSKDQEAERRAREFANLPQTRSAGNESRGGRLAQKPGLERFVRRPAHQTQGIGAKHTNIFTTITQSYARHSERLMP